MNNLKVDKVSYKYGKKKALDNVSFEVSDGLIGILGANGAGKTTLMKLLTTLYGTLNGEICLNHMDYKKDMDKIRGSLGYLPQGFKVYNNLTGIEFLNIMAELKVKDKISAKKEIDNVIKRLSMEEFIKDRVGTYSGGMKQKLGFAQMLLGDPSLIIADEPTVGLDPEQRNVIREIFPIISRGRIVLITTHIVEDIESYCNSLIVMRKGELIYSGGKTEFIEKAKGYIWNTEISAEKYMEVYDNWNIVKSTQKDNSFKIRYISKEKLTDDSKVIEEPNLEDAYISYQKLWV